MLKHTVLITGGSGLIGTRLSELLIEEGYNINWLSRKNGKKGDINIYHWDYLKNEIEPKAIENADYIVHLAGASVAGKRWTKSYKQEILESRTKTTFLLAELLSNRKHNVKAFISASAIGYYGSDRGTEKITEESSEGKDYLAEVTKAWEKSVDKIALLGIRTVKIRTGIVLSEKGGALEKIAKPIKLGFGAAIGSGNQIMPWIHVDDLCRIYLQAIKNENMKGVYNAVAPNPITNKVLTYKIAEKYQKKIILPNVPQFVLRGMLGEIAESVVGSLNVSAEKIIKTGFEFKYKRIEEALASLLH